MLNPSRSILALSALLGSIWLPHAGRADEAPTLMPMSTGTLSPQALRTIGVTIDFARIMTFDAPIGTIVIGNPAIVDGTLSDPTTLILTGKAVGVTNLIVLGSAGQEVANLVVNVAANSNQLTTVYHGANLQTFSCHGTCRPLAAPVSATAK